ncbi:MAG: acetylxylan esterase [Propionibacteriaceae bacterium]|jgi:cephalosporin-C deacetylase|nr:acetylxylan esterase [Propionibacteriaceae bacterium]
MPRLDLPAAELRAYRPEVAEPADFDQFWASTLADHCPGPARAELTPWAGQLQLVDVWDVSFGGFDDHPVKAWLVAPRAATGPLPGVVEFIGYGGGRGLPHERLAWAAAGYAYLYVDVRGQGSAWGAGGQTADPVGSGPAAPGFMTRGLESPQTYYYRRVFVDAVRAVEAMRQLPLVDADRVSVTGGSQGGGIAIAAAGLSAGLLAALPDVPFLCHFQRAVGFTDRDPYQEIVRYLSVHRGTEDQIFHTLSYFDGVNFARRASAPALFSVGHLDPVCPPSTVYAAFNHWAAPAEMVEYPFNEHEGGGPAQWLRQADWLAQRI